MTSSDVITILTFLLFAQANSVLAQLAIYHYKLDIYGRAWDLELWCERERDALFWPILDSLLTGCIFVFLYGLFGIVLRWHIMTGLIVGAGLLGQGFFLLKRFFFIFVGQTFFWWRLIFISIVTFWTCPYLLAVTVLLGMFIAIMTAGVYYLLAPDGTQE